MSSLNSLLLQWKQNGQLDTSKVPKDELAMTLVLLYMRDAKQQVFCKDRYPEKPADLRFQHAVLAELYAHGCFHRDLKMNAVVIETVYENTSATSPLRKFIANCWMGCWPRDQDEIL